MNYLPIVSKEETPGTAHTELVRQSPLHRGPSLHSHGNCQGIKKTLPIGLGALPGPHIQPSAGKKAVVAVTIWCLQGGAWQVWALGLSALAPLGSRGSLPSPVPARTRRSPSWASHRWAGRCLQALQLEEPARDCW